MKNQLRENLIYFWTVGILFTLLAFLPAAGHCDSGNGWFRNLFESKGKNMKEVAKKIKTLNEDKAILGVDFSPDGKYLVAAGENGADIHVWDWQNGRIVRTLVKARGAYTGLTSEPIRFSPDGRLLAACHSLALGDVVVRIWNTNTWEIVHDITDSQKGGGCNAIGFTPDGKSLIRVLDRAPEFPGDTFIIYNTDTWQPVWGLRTVPFQLGALAISPDGKFVALGGEVIPGGQNYTQIAIVDMAKRTIIRTIHSPLVNQLAWSPDGVHITAAGVGLNGDDAIRIFDAQSGTLTAGEALESGHTIIRYTPDGKYLIESGEAGLRIWDGQHRELLQEIPRDGKNYADSLAVSRDGHFFAAGFYTNVLIWQLN